MCAKAKDFLDMPAVKRLVHEMSKEEQAKVVADGVKKHNENRYPDEDA